MKKLLTFLFVILVFAAFGCVDKETKPTDDSAKKTEVETPKKDDKKKQEAAKVIPKLTIYISKTTDKSVELFADIAGFEGNPKSLENIQMSAEVVGMKEPKVSELKFDKDANKFSNDNKESKIKFELKDENRSLKDVLTKISFVNKQTPDKPFDVDFKTLKDVTAFDEKNKIITKMEISKDKEKLADITLGGLTAIEGKKINWFLNENGTNESSLKLGGTDTVCDVKNGKAVINLKGFGDKISAAETDQGLLEIHYSEDLTKSWVIDESMTVLVSFDIADSIAVDFK